MCTFVLLSTATFLRAEEVKHGQPSAYLPEKIHEFGPTLSGSKVVYGFSIQNRGTATLEIKKVKTD